MLDIDVVHVDLPLHRVSSGPKGKVFTKSADRGNRVAWKSPRAYSCHVPAGTVVGFSSADRLVNGLPSLSFGELPVTDSPEDTPALAAVDASGSRRSSGSSIPS